MARIKNGVPTVKEIKEGESLHRYVEGVGLVMYTRYNNQLYSNKMQPLSSPAIADKKLELLIDNKINTSIASDEFIKSDGRVTYIGNQSFGGNNITGVNDLTVIDDITVGDDITVSGELNVDGHSKLDQTTIDIADGAFLASGANSITLTTTGSNDVNITSGQTLDVGVGLDYELDVTRNCDWNTAVTDWDNSGTFTLTSLANITIETDGTDGDSSGNDDSSNTILIKNANSNNSDFTGIHIKTDSQGAGSAFNGILIECDNIAGKGGTAGVDVRSENGIRIRAENDNAGGTTGLLMRATGPIDVGVGSSLTAHSSNSRVKIHGTNGIEFAVLYRADGSTAINTTDATWDKIDTLNLVRAMTYKASDATLASGSLITIVTGVNDDNIEATIWRVAVYWNHGSSNPNFQLWHCFATTSGTMNVVKDAEVLSSGAGGTLAWSSGDSGGIKWRNDHASSNADVKASALKIQSGNDF